MISAVAVAGWSILSGSILLIVYVIRGLIFGKGYSDSVWVALSMILQTLIYQPVLLAKIPVRSAFARPARWLVVAGAAAISVAVRNNERETIFYISKVYDNVYNVLMNNFVWIIMHTIEMISIIFLPLVNVPLVFRYETYTSLVRTSLTCTEGLNPLLESFLDLGNALGAFAGSVTEFVVAFWSKRLDLVPAIGHLQNIPLRFYKILKCSCSTFYPIYGALLRLVSNSDVAVAIDGLVNGGIRLAQYPYKFFSTLGGDMDTADIVGEFTVGLEAVGINIDNIIEEFMSIAKGVTSGGRYMLPRPYFGGVLMRSVIALLTLADHGVRLPLSLVSGNWYEFNRALDLAPYFNAIDDPTGAGVVTPLAMSTQMTVNWLFLDFPQQKYTFPTSCTAKNILRPDATICDCHHSCGNLGLCIKSRGACVPRFSYNGQTLHAIPGVPSSLLVKKTLRVFDCADDVQFAAKTSEGRCRCMWPMKYNPLTNRCSKNPLVHVGFEDYAPVVKLKAENCTQTANCTGTCDDSAIVQKMANDTTFKTVVTGTEVIVRDSDLNNVLDVLAPKCDIDYGITDADTFKTYYGEIDCEHHDGAVEHYEQPQVFCTLRHGLGLPVGIVRVMYSTLYGYIVLQDGDSLQKNLNEFQVHVFDNMDTFAYHLPIVGMAALDYSSLLHDTVGQFTYGALRGVSEGAKATITTIANLDTLRHFFNTPFENPDCSTPETCRCNFDREQNEIGHRCGDLIFKDANDYFELALAAPFNILRFIPYERTEEQCRTGDVMPVGQATWLNIWFTDEGEIREQLAIDSEVDDPELKFKLVRHNQKTCRIRNAPTFGCNLHQALEIPTRQLVDTLQWLESAIILTIFVDIKFIEPQIFHIVCALNQHMGHLSGAIGDVLQAVKIPRSVSMRLSQAFFTYQEALLGLPAAFTLYAVDRIKNVFEGINILTVIVLLYGDFVKLMFTGVYKIFAFISVLIYNEPNPPSGILKKSMDILSTFVEFFSKEMIIIATYFASFFMNALSLLGGNGDALMEMLNDIAQVFLAVIDILVHAVPALLNFIWNLPIIGQVLRILAATICHVFFGIIDFLSLIVDGINHIPFVSLDNPFDSLGGHDQCPDFTRRRLGEAHSVESLANMTFYRAQEDLDWSGDTTCALFGNGDQVPKTNLEIAFWYNCVKSRVILKLFEEVLVVPSNILDDVFTFGKFVGSMAIGTIMYLSGQYTLEDLAAARMPAESIHMLYTNGLGVIHYLRTEANFTAAIHRTAMSNTSKDAVIRFINRVPTVGPLPTRDDAKQLVRDANNSYHETRRALASTYVDYKPPPIREKKASRRLTESMETASGESLEFTVIKNPPFTDAKNADCKLITDMVVSIFNTIKAMFNNYPETITDAWERYNFFLVKLKKLDSSGPSPTIKPKDSNPNPVPSVKGKALMDPPAEKAIAPLALNGVTPATAFDHFFTGQAGDDNVPFVKNSLAKWIDDILADCRYEELFEKRCGVPLYSIADSISMVAYTYLAMMVLETMTMGLIRVPGIIKFPLLSMIFMAARYNVGPLCIAIVPPCVMRDIQLAIDWFVPPCICKSTLGKGFLQYQCNSCTDQISYTHTCPTKGLLYPALQAIHWATPELFGLVFGSTASPLRQFGKTDPDIQYMLTHPASALEKSCTLMHSADIVVIFGVAGTIFALTAQIVGALLKIFIQVVTLVALVIRDRGRTTNT